jgi:Ni/Fe-hydrogenase subunit HybB-like protein
MIGCAVLILIGTIAFFIGIAGSQPERAWQAYLVNFVFWTGMAFGAVLLSAILTMTNARWGRPIKRLAEAPGAFLPVSFLLFWVLYFGREKIFPWIHEPVHHKEAWLNTGFLFTRDGVGLLILTALSMAIIHYSVRGDSRAMSEGVDSPVETERNLRVQSLLSPIFAILYALILTLIAFDLIMSLDPHWISTLFGAYYFMGSFYTGLAAVIILSALSVRTMGLDRFVGSKQFHDLGKLLFGFCVVTGDFFYAQFLVIWYGNLPEETHYVILRVNASPWKYLAWTVLIVSFVFPFIVLISRKVKMRPLLMMVLCSIILVGMWLERFLLVAPSIWRGERMPLGFMELFITAGFSGIMALCLLLFFRKYPMLPVSDPFFHELMNTPEAGE